jgi:hypothetical protein
MLQPRQCFFLHLQFKLTFFLVVVVLDLLNLQPEFRAWGCIVLMFVAVLSKRFVDSSIVSEISLAVRPFFSGTTVDSPSSAKRLLGFPDLALPF